MSKLDRNSNPAVHGGDRQPLQLALALNLINHNRSLKIVLEIWKTSCVAIVVKIFGINVCIEKPTGEAFGRCFKIANELMKLMNQSAFAKASADVGTND